MNMKMHENIILGNRTRKYTKPEFERQTDKQARTNTGRF